ncbi:hypothetical protein SAMN05192560_0969 [Methylobacillus rhizosphaerae]|uniref:Esterase n=1 Tax=Methylobacillus rhizosphaerae TaxID=551994 RepID=A0A238Z174_9PROT|nr:YqiA/YcfP family alpha/beta fold hydrolase [Methylobacillus rhizosphaerae]SNR76594.1 hypothetical protein SAMN05192560_0969 [Methylobacillus rhizosphaerae]
MSIVYMPGFNSSPASEKSCLLRQHFPHIVVPEYNTWDPDISYTQLDQTIRPLATSGALLTGSSLGGFWAYHFACRYRLPCLLINPCMYPEKSLHRYLGTVENFYTHERGTLTQANLDRYAHYQPVGQPRHTCVLHEQGDELIPYQESIRNFMGRARLLLPGGGNHRFVRTELIISSIKDMLSHQHGSGAPTHAIHSPVPTALK